MEKETDSGKISAHSLAMRQSMDENGQNGCCQRDEHQRIEERKAHKNAAFMPPASTAPST
jgi:hypothetical protein